MCEKQKVESIIGVIGKVWICKWRILYVFGGWILIKKWGGFGVIFRIFLCNFYVKFYEIFMQFLKYTMACV